MSVNPGLGGYQSYLRTLLIADGETWWITRGGGGITGIDVVEPKDTGVSLGHDHGSVSGLTYKQDRLITIATMCSEGTAALAEAALVLLGTAWDTATSADLALGMYVPGRGTGSVYGRPIGGLSEDRSDVGTGTIRCLLKFWCPNPSITWTPGS